MKVTLETVDPGDIPVELRVQLTVSELRVLLDLLNGIREPDSRIDGVVSALREQLRAECRGKLGL